MNTYQKLNLARQMFHKKELKKSGLNKFVGYKYFELADFLIPALEIFYDVGLNSTIGFNKDIALMEIRNVESPDEHIIHISSPMSDAALKGCHPVQNLGAVQTYLTRYLWTQALCITEHDALDATTGNTSAPKIKPTSSDIDLDEDQKNNILEAKIAIEDLFANQDVVGAYMQYIKITDQEEKIALWGMLDSKVRSAIKKHGESLKGE
jgi:ERF superfamily